MRLQIGPPGAFLGIRLPVCLHLATKFCLSNGQKSRSACKSSGLKSAEKILKGIEGIAFVKLGERDVVRHNLVREIITAYEKNNSMGKGE